MNRYRITERAQTDLEAIWDYTLDRWSSEQAEKYVDGLLSYFDDVADGTAFTKDAGYVRAGYRRASFNKHYVFYRLGDDQQVEIIRVLHVSMDIEKHLE